MNRRITAILAALAMLLCSAALPVSAEEIQPPDCAEEPIPAVDTSPVLLEPLPPAEEYCTENGLRFIIYTPNPYYTTNTDRYASVAGVEEDAVSVTIPAEVQGVPVTGVASGALRSTALKEILVDKAQTNYVSKDGVLFDKTGTTLEAYPLGKTGTYAVPDGTKTIGYAAFLAPEGYDGLTEITFPETLNRISPHAFSNQCGLTEIVLPDSVSEVQEYAFSDCKGLKTIHLSQSLRIFYQCCGGCTSLQELTGKPTYFYSKDNVLFSGGSVNPDELVLYPAGLTAERYVLPDTTTRIRSGAFSDNAYLKEAVLPESLTDVGDAFRNMAALETLTFPHGVTSIGDACIGCPALKTISLPSTLTYIGTSFLRSTPALTDVYYDGLEEAFEKVSNVLSNKYIRRTSVTVHYADENDYETVFDGNETDGGFTYKVYAGHAEVAGYTHGTKQDLSKTAQVAAEIKGVPVTAVGRRAFASLANIYAVELPDSIRTIGAYAFQGALVQTNIPAHVETIGESAFFGASIQKVTLPGTLRSMGDFAFRKSRVQSVTVGEGVTELGKYAFLECSHLTEVRLPSTLTSVSYGAFSLTPSLCSVALPYGVKSIGFRAFDGSGIRKINLPDTLTELGERSLSNCRNLTAVTIPPQITALPANLLCGSGVTEVTVPATVSSIGPMAFCDCQNLRRINILNPACEICPEPETICTLLELYDYTQPVDGCEPDWIEPVAHYENLTICGYADSTAQSHAETYGIPFEVYDPEGYDVVDAVALQRYLLGAGASGLHRDYDLSGDGRTDVFDLALLKRRLVQK